MGNPLLSILKSGIVTQREMFPMLPDGANGLPAVTASACDGDSCGKCAELCPTKAIEITGGDVSLDRGRCIGCSACVEICPAGTIIRDLSTKTAVANRQDLILPPQNVAAKTTLPVSTPFLRSLHIREVSTGDSGSDAEVSASTNSIFDVARFGVHFVASPRFADALLVTGPVGRAMQEPLRRCYEAMAEPRLVIAVGAGAISGGVHSGGYASANGVGDIVPVAVFVPGDPPHPWSIIHGILLAMGRV
jgi:Ni,Fe-hydrogenase III small subunit/NAD-dependent dihydropyrimidine dehydrogenase PreA subunit